MGWDEIEIYFKSQILVNKDEWLSIVSKFLIISLAIMIARKKYVTVKEEKWANLFQKNQLLSGMHWLPSLLHL